MTRARNQSRALAHAGNLSQVLSRELLVNNHKKDKQMIKVKVRVRMKTSPSLVVAFAMKSLNETIRVLKPKAQEAKTLGTYE